MIRRLQQFHAKLLDTVDRRWRRSRPGSVLILVVALLVLLALLGTAYINTAQTDRYSSTQNTFNVEIDLLLQGLENMTAGTITSGLFNSNFHQDNTTNTSEKDSNNNIFYQAADYPLNNPSLFIADRYPTVPELSLSPSSSNLPEWAFISGLLPGIKQFAAPNNLSNKYTSNRQNLYPYYVPLTITESNGTSTIQNFPGLWDGVNGDPVALAADTDGDGIADAQLFQLPVGQINGITYYGAIRVVDNSAAVNVANAWGPFADFATPLIPGNFYPSNIDLLGLLNTSDVPGSTSAGLMALQTYRCGNNSAGPSATPFDDRPNAQPLSTTTPPPNQAPPAIQRSDFAFGTASEALWMQLGRRLNNPGYISATQQYNALSLSEMASLSHHFIIANPLVVANPSISSSYAEQYLTHSLLTGAPTSAYAANNYLSWYTSNFDWAHNSNLPLRSALVTRNPATNFVMSKLYSRGAYVSGHTYYFGDWVTNPDPTTGATRAYVCLQTTSASPATVPSHFTTATPTPWEQEPWVSAPTKVSANTATFGQLWAGYFSAMSAYSTPSTASATTPTPGWANNQTVVVPAAYAGGGSSPVNAMFRSSFPSNVAPTGWGANQELILRAAQAAVNTLALRSNNTALISETFTITGSDLSTQFTCTVYGTAPQPYITETYASLDLAGNTYAAIELYNPYPVSIDLTNWQLASTTIGSTLTAPTSIGTFSQGGLPSTIAPNSYLVIESGPPPAGNVPPTGTPIQLPALANLLPSTTNVTPVNGGFLLLLRPPPSGVTTTLSAMVPVDYYDFTNFPRLPQDPAGMYWHYIRPNNPAPVTVATGVTTTKAWHFVYPGYYPLAAAGTGPGFYPKQAGTFVGAAYNPAQDLSSLGAADSAVATSGYIDRPLQIANTDTAGPKGTAPNTVTGVTGMYPYGGFARNLDLQQVTFIGPYTITDSSGNILAMNPVTLDSAFANDTSLDDDIWSEQMGRQNIGRFAPVSWADTLLSQRYNSNLANGTTTPLASSETALAYEPSPPNAPLTYVQSLWDDYIIAAPAPSPAPNYWPKATSYYWTMQLPNYVTVQAPHDDYLPDADPNAQDTGGTTPTAVANSSYLIANAGSSTSPNYPVSATEETAGVHGRININTANWRLLATVPFTDGFTYGGNPNAAGIANSVIAASIVYYRDVDDGTRAVLNTTPPTLHPHGAFQSIEELNNVPILTGTSTALSVPSPFPAGTLLRNVLGSDYVTGTTTFTVAGPHAANIDGDLSPLLASGQTLATYNSGTENVIGDFENQNLAVNRVSNLITTRSDSFTVYLLVQGWRNAGTANPQLVVQRRGAFVIDRSAITPSNTTQASITNLP